MEGGTKSGMNMLDSAWNRMVLFNRRENDNTLKDVPFLCFVSFGIKEMNIKSSFFFVLHFDAAQQPK
jgi:hypothetical protein